MTSDVNLDERYLDWLYSKVGSVSNKNPARTYILLAEQMHNTRFNWTVPNDDNRIEDGKDLRQEFLLETNAECDQEWLERDCSMLEMLIALSRRVEFESAKDTFYWFWKILENLQIRSCTDEAYLEDDRVPMIVDQAIYRVINRTYGSNGEGGMFPLKHSNQDQRKVEIWYQMGAYLLENGYD